MQSTKPSIFIIEDDQAIRESLYELLTFEGYPVLLAENGLKALEALSSLPKSPALILVDLSMPVMNGNTFLVEFKKQFPQWSSTPVIIMTAAGSKMVPADRNAQMVLKKPLDIDQLMCAIEAVS